MKSARFKIIILLISVLFSIHCAKSELSNENAVPKVEIPAPKQFVLGRWKYSEEITVLGKRIRTEENTYLTFLDNDTVIFEFRNSKTVLDYKINEKNEIEIELNYDPNLVVKKINESEMRLRPKREGGYLDFPILFSFTDENFRRVE